MMVLSFYGKVEFAFLEELKNFAEDFGAKVQNTDQQVSTRTVLCIGGQDHPLTFNQCVSCFDSFKLS